ncbi:sporulation lipoprotein, YhcN/YlaJ family [Paenibacillus sp. yr247]|uniref:YhcN/YlaJ family sporulation lipoprotein n=1 Tax=Paenibacillus sp. yr247 TaxID=1761880 RepID=UPI00088FA397|nr:YhcN/YlaJ family sporulation lipoprotein [Paenibacillus sp. yr247]SDO77640.1 sporulation lipoprotein, YhcN/YlaJ family [Paenibacillus sp. yr247]
MSKPWKLPIKILLVGSCLLLPVTACSSPRNKNLQQQSITNQPLSTISPNVTTKNANQKFVVAEQSASQLTKVPGVRQANVLVTDRTAYVAVVLDKNLSLTADLENQISTQVKSVDPAIDKVYVSVNPDFVGRVNTYVSEVRSGRPISGLVNELSDVVYRLFPKAR